MSVLNLFFNYSDDSSLATTIRYSFPFFAGLCPTIKLLFVFRDSPAHSTLINLQSITEIKLLTKIQTLIIKKLNMIKTKLITKYTDKNLNLELQSVFLYFKSRNRIL